MTLIVLYLVTLAVFLGVDAVMLKTVMKPLFERHLGDMMLAQPDLRPAAAFYLVYVGGVLWFCAWPALAPGGGGWAAAALNGALLGALAYGTYEFVNISTLKGWSWTMVAADTAWGATLTGASAAAGVALVGALGLGRG
ncbi:MAG: DUF2177 family protein [Pseudomonadota bacterium]